MKFDLKEITESIRIKSNEISIEVLTTIGKDGDFFIMISPTLLVSGYGKNTIEAEDSFKHNMEVFCNDLLALSDKKRLAYLYQLGFKKQHLRKKDFSKLYIDKEGVLNGLEPITVKTSIVTTEY